MQKKTRIWLNNFLFSLFWWVIQRVSPERGERLLYWGLQSGAFPNRAHEDPRLAVNVLGFKLKTPIGVGPGFDKLEGTVDDLISMGAGFGEMGPYTLDAEDPVTATFYLRREKAVLVQSLGYQNIGISAMLPSLIKRRYLPNIVGVNIAIVSEVESENVKQNHVMSYPEEFDLMTRKIAPYCDFITVNFSHPETELYRLVSDASTMIPLIRTVKRAALSAAAVHTPKVLVKIPLNMTSMELPLVCQHLMAADVDGIIVGGSLSLSQSKLRLTQQMHAGMLSGAPLKSYVVDLIAQVYQATKGKIPIIACGGVWTGRDAYDCLAAGASLIQIGTVIRYEGPNAVTRINKELLAILKEKKLHFVSEAVGADFK